MFQCMTIYVRMFQCMTIYVRASDAASLSINKFALMLCNILYDK